MSAADTASVAQRRQQTPHADRAKRWLMIAAGSVSLALGIVGLILPVLPTTPFLLLTAMCYMRGSKRLHRWLISHRVFGAYIDNYITRRAMKKSTKTAALLFLWSMLIVSAALAWQAHMALALFAVGVCVSVHIIKLRTLENP